jgi:hypothetical protein
LICAGGVGKRGTAKARRALRKKKFNHKVHQGHKENTKVSELKSIPQRREGRKERRSLKPQRHRGHEVKNGLDFSKLCALRAPSDGGLCG